MVLSFVNIFLVWLNCSLHFKVAILLYKEFLVIIYLHLGPLKKMAPKINVDTIFNHFRLQFKSFPFKLLLNEGLLYLSLEGLWREENWMFHCISDEGLLYLSLEGLWREEKWMFHCISDEQYSCVLIFRQIYASWQKERKRQSEKNWLGKNKNISLTL